jgi:nitroreductase
MRFKSYPLVLCALGAGSLACAVPGKTKLKIDRCPEYAEVDSLFIERWSPRAMSGQEVTDHELMMLFEAARWAPSSYNEQPWRFLYAKKGTQHWQTFFDLLVPFNQEWCKNGSALVVVVSKNDSSRGGLNQTHSFDTGAAWQNIALQGHLKGLVVHGMGGFDHQKAAQVLQVPADYTVEAMFVVGKPGNLNVLPKEMQTYEKPSDRKPLHSIVAQGHFSFAE